MILLPLPSCLPEACRSGESVGLRADRRGPPVTREAR
jgi:hypothetical protein